MTLYRDIHEARDDARKSYDYGIAKIREREIRKGNMKPLPSNAEELRWAEEGEIEVAGSK